MQQTENLSIPVGADGEAPEVAPAVRPQEEIREVRAHLGAPEILDRLDTAARRGRLPGFHRGAGSFRIRIFGQAFERELVASIAHDGGGSVIRFRLRLMPMMPLVFGITTLVTIWPGVWLTDSMIKAYYPPAQDWWPTWAWYLPLTVLPLPWAARSMWRKSQATAAEEVRKTIEAVERETR